jgi:hypothetical protein
MVTRQLSGDVTMQSSYRAGDVYLAFAKLAGAVPADATKVTRPRERSLFKTVILGTQYLIGAASLAHRLGVSLHEAADLLEQHHRIYAKFGLGPMRCLTTVNCEGRSQPPSVGSFV